jgi:hypothetical protein
MITTTLTLRLAASAGEPIRFFGPLLAFFHNFSLFIHNKFYDVSLSRASTRLLAFLIQQQNNDANESVCLKK